MSTALLIAAQEWRYWLRTQLASVVALLALILICASLFATYSQLQNEKSARTALQLKAEETFRNQPARHPHRMVHYGHYVFRTPTALAALDPGVDPFTGTVMFLEGHRQNSATFSPSYAGAQAGPFSRLTPALAYQLFVPLVLIVMGFGIVAREREASTDRQLITAGISPVSIWFGKTLALIAVALLLLLPMLLGVVFTNSTWSLGSGFLGLYALYLLVWVVIVSAVSTWSKQAWVSLLILLTLWTMICIVLPRLIVISVSTVHPSTSKIESDMEVIQALRSIGDGHNANDPAFNRLKSNLLAEYGVDKVEDLPINFRGVVAETAETELTQIFNTFAEKRMATQLNQTQLIQSYQSLSPFVALQSASMIAAGTDVKTHHRFLREAEAVRYQFVQDLNSLHQHELDYQVDINRGLNEDSSRRARVDSENWRLLKDFRFDADPAQKRLKGLVPSYAAMLLWLLVFILLGFIGARRLPEVNHA